MYEEACFSKKNFLNQQNMDLLLQAQVKKTVHRVETHWHSGKEKVPGAAVNKEGDADSLLRYERTYHYWFPLKKVKL